METTEKNDAFLNRVLANNAVIIKICNTFCNNQADQQDLAQEITYYLLKGEKSFNPDFKFTTWMYRVALNVAITFYRSKRKLKNTISISGIELEIEDPQPELPDADEDLNKLHQLVKSLKALDRALILLYFEDKSYKEIAEIMGISETNTATKISRIKRKLKQNLITSKK